MMSIGQKFTVARSIRRQDEVCAYGDHHSVVICETLTLTVVKEEMGADTSGYPRQPDGLWRWAEDGRGNTYVQKANAMLSNPGWQSLADGSDVYWSPSVFLLARDEQGNPLTPQTPPRNPDSRG